MDDGVKAKEMHEYICEVAFLDECVPIIKRGFWWCSQDAADICGTEAWMEQGSHGEEFGVKVTDVVTGAIEFFDGEIEMHTSLRKVSSKDLAERLAEFENDIAKEKEHNDRLQQRDSTGTVQQTKGGK